MARVSDDERFLSLAALNIGEALAELANQRLRGGVPGTDMATVRDKLRRAIAATDGKVWTPPVDPQHENPTSKEG